MHDSLSPKPHGRPGINRVGAAFLALVVIAASVGSNIGGTDAHAPGWLGLAVILVSGAAVFAGLLVVIWAGGYAAFAGTSLRNKILVVLGTAAAVLVGLVMLVVFPRLGSERPWIAGGSRTGCLDGVFWWMHFPSRRDELYTHPERFCWPSAGAKAAGSTKGAGPEIPGAVVAVAEGAVMALIIAAVVAAIAVRRSRRRIRAPTAEDDPVVLALDESLDDLRRERDVRRAIVACYARMERAFAGAGRARRPHETPLEFLRRVLARVAKEPGQVLTELFECARFSVEPMGEVEKRSAIAALEQLRARIGE